MQTDDIFSRFTRRYALSKTLRFELKPIGKTLDNMREHLDYDEALQTFLKDQCIEDAYQTLKPLVDPLHEEFITDSLNSTLAREIQFPAYIDARAKLLKRKGILKNEGKSKVEIAGDREIGRLESELDTLGAKLRSAFGKVFDEAGETWKKKYAKYTWNKGSNIAKGAKVLSCQDALSLIGDTHPEEKIQSALNEFKGFFTYFGGFNQNRENYYETGKEAVTAVATRIVDENLPRFTDNVLVFESRRDQYLGAYAFLQKIGRTLQNREGKALRPIHETIFNWSHFGSCLSQQQIEQYNEEIGNTNFVVNLYNQARNGEHGFKRLPTFKTLYKQIGCGKKDPLFFALTHEQKSEAEGARKQDGGKKFFSVEEIVGLAMDAGKKYFERSNGGEIDSLPEFVEYLTKRPDYSGFYWSKAALNTISNKYFANWYDLKGRFKRAKVFKKGDEEDVRVPEVIELQEFFEVLDETPDWKASLFKQGLLEEKSGTEKIIGSSKSPHEALLGMTTADMMDCATRFVDGVGEVTRITQEYFSLPDSSSAKEEKRKRWKEAIKVWMDYALAINRMLKYFKVRESKVKGTPIDTPLSQTLDTLLYGKDDEVEWFKWYDALRNFLTKKPQDDAKENKLKLNFENGSLLGGWSDGQEKNKAAVLLRKDGLYYLGILKKKSIFNTENENNEIYKNITFASGRLILANLKFQTLAGKGFLGEFGMAYGDMGKRDPQGAVLCLQKIIRERYVSKYPLLRRIALSEYTDKKKFDKDIQKALSESYVCEFKDIDWRKVEAYTETGDMYLFQIFCKDFASGRSGKKDHQTVYWESLFKDASPHQLNGGGEVFYRKQALKENRVKKGYEEKPWIIEQKRFTEKDGKFAFHCPIKLNYKSVAQSKPEYAFPFVNKYVNEYLSHHPSICFLGIDRGEKHLAYYSLVDAQGRILAQDTLNVPFTDKNGNPRMVKAKKRFLDRDGKEQEVEVECRDYNDLLEARAGDRDYARKNWQTIGTIKELKEGYISQVVHNIAKLAVFETDKPTFIVLEDLSTGFMRGRQKIEKSVYKKLEVALMKKLGFLVDKSKDGKYGEIGSVTNALQLTPRVNNYEELKGKGKQAGVMLFVRPNYTSQTDPVTGWRKKIYISEGSEEDIRKKIVENFTDIYFDGKDYVFVYTDSDTGKKWQMYSGKDGKGLDRFYRQHGNKGEWISMRQNLVEMLDGLFTRFDKNSSVLEQIKAGIGLTKISEHTAWESLRFAINLIQQIRNTGETMNERDADFILSPVRDESRNHFDSRMYWDKKHNGEQVTLAVSGDANGAYNIARKGILLNEHIQRDLKLYVRDEEWDAWLAGSDTWEKWMKENIQSLRKQKPTGQF